MRIATITVNGYNYYFYLKTKTMIDYKHLTLQGHGIVKTTESEDWYTNKELVEVAKKLISIGREMLDDVSHYNQRGAIVLTEHEQKQILREWAEELDLEITCNCDDDETAPAKVCGICE